MTDEHDWFKWEFPCELDKNYDGDTLRLVLDLGFGVKLRKRVQLYGIDTPELDAVDPDIRELAKIARQAVKEGIEKAERVYFRSHNWGGHYEDPQGDVFLDGDSLSRTLVYNRLAVGFSGHDRSQLNTAHKSNAKYVLRRQGGPSTEEE